MDTTISTPDAAPRPVTKRGLRIETRHVATYGADGKLVEVAIYDETGKLVSRTRPPRPRPRTVKPPAVSGAGRFTADEARSAVRAVKRRRAAP